MTSTESAQGPGWAGSPAAAESPLARRPQRADARRNYETLIAVARDTFATEGVSASLEEIARKAGVGIGTLYRHFPTRQALFESVYAEDVEEVRRSADAVAGMPPWEALTTWMYRFVDYLATKRALAEAVNLHSDMFADGRAAMHEAGESLLRRAQDAGLARDEVSFDDVLRLVWGLTMVEFREPGQRERVLAMALDGIRAQRG